MDVEGHGADAADAPFVRSARLIRDGIYDRLFCCRCRCFCDSPDQNAAQGPHTTVATNRPAVGVYLYDAIVRMPSAKPILMIPLNYNNTTTIGISVCRGFDDPVFVQGGIETDALFIKHLLMQMTDVTFAARRWPEQLFDAVESTRVQQVFNQEGETYFGEIRLEIDFRFQEPFVPIITDRFRELRIRLRDFIKHELPPFHPYLPDLPQHRGHDHDA